MGFAIIGFSFLVYNLVDNWLIVILISIAAISIGEVISFPFSNAFALSRSTPGRRGQFMGLYSMSFSAAFIIAPPLGLGIADKYGYTELWYFMTCLTIIACLGFGLLKYAMKKSKPEPEKQYHEIHLD